VAISLIMKPYTGQRPGLFTRFSLVVGLVFLSVLYGFLCAILPFRLLVVPLVPIVFMALLILWLLPDIGGVRDEFVSKYFLLFVGINALWPPVAALNLPGIPVVSPTRVALFAALIVFAVNFSTSSQMRSQVVEAMNAQPLLRKLFWLFWTTTVIALPLSAVGSFAILRWLNSQVYWTMVLAASAWLATRKGFALNVAQALAWTLIITSVIGINEFRMEEMGWPEFLPPWLRADEAMYAKLFEPSYRPYTDNYRVRGILGNALYTAEYMAIAFPFVIYALTRAKRPLYMLLLAAGTLATMMTMYFTGSRSAMVGIVITFAIYPLLEALRARRQRPTSLFANTVMYAYPFFAGILAAVILFWRRAHVAVLGGGQHEGSNDARTVQWEMGWPKIISHPFGQGSGSSGEVLGYFTPGGVMPTVDSYFLTLLLEYGFLGLAFFFALFALAIWGAARAYIYARDEESLLLAPLAIAFTNFLVIKSAASTESSFPIVFMLLGVSFVLVARVRAEAGLNLLTARNFWR